MSGRPDREALGRHRDTSRREEILQVAAVAFASYGYVRTSLKDVADACGILPGSLYHHFGSKEAIAVELVSRYHGELDRIGQSALSRRARGQTDAGTTAIVELGIEIADCALRHRAALQLSLYEPSAHAGPELTAVNEERSGSAIESAMQQLLVDARERERIDAGIDLPVLSAQISQTMLHVGLSVLHRDASARNVATLMCRMLFEGLAWQAPSNDELDCSAPMIAAKREVDTWATDDAGKDERTRVLVAAARAEFAKRGYEATTVRDISAASGMGTGSVYRLVQSKEELLAGIMNSFHARLSSAYDAVEKSSGSAVEKIDALAWINLSAAERFDSEFDIQRAWFRISPPTPNILGDSRMRRARQLEALLAEGRDRGELRFDEYPMATLWPGVRDLIWVAPSITAGAAPREFLRHIRATVLRGAAHPSLV